MGRQLEQADAEALLAAIRVLRDQGARRSHGRWPHARRNGFTEPGGRTGELVACDQTTSRCRKRGTGSVPSAGTTGNSPGPASESKPPMCAGSPLKGPDSLDNGLAMCSLHHKLFDLG